MGTIGNVTFVRSVKPMNIRILMLFTALMSWCTPMLYGQYQLGGRIVNKQQEPVDHALVFLLEGKDSVILQTVLPDSTGVYRFDSPVLQHKLVRVSAMGYREVTVKTADTFSPAQVMDFILEESQQNLGNVVISAAKPLFERKTDRTVFYVANSIHADGGTALEALKRSPGVWVRQHENTIGLIGKSAVQVLINDRLLQLSGEDMIAYLEAIPSGNIDRIEVITAPPAKYEAGGNSGLINIVLKKNNRMGMNGNLRLALEQASYVKGIAGGDLNYRKGKLNLYGNISYSNGANDITERLRTTYTEQVYQVTDQYKRILKPLQYTAGADYELHPNGMIGFQWMSNNGNRINDAQTGIEVHQRSSGTLDSTMLTRGYSTVRNSNNILNLNYAWAIDTAGKKLTFNTNRLWYTGRRNNDFETTRYQDAFVTPAGPESKNGSEGNQDIRISTVQADLALPYTWASLSVGGKLSFIDNKSNNHFGYYDQDIYYEDSMISNAFHYAEQVQALYISAQKACGKWSFQAGLRAEFTQTRGQSLSLNQDNTNRYFNLFPTAYVQYQPGENHNWNLSYSKRINRPDYRSLDPFRAYATPYHYSEGNPFLLPSFNHNLELAYTFKNRYTFSAYYQYEQDHFASVWLTDPVQKITSGISMNFADFTGYGLNATATFQPAPWWEAQVQLSLQQQELRSKIYAASEQSYHLWMYYAACNNSFALNKDKTLLTEINAYYLSRYREDFLEIDPTGSLDIGLKALLSGKKITLSLNASDIFATQKARGKHVVTGQFINNYFDTRNVRLTFNYRFGNNKIQAKRERNTGIEEEKGRAG